MTQRTLKNLQRKTLSGLKEIADNTCPETYTDQDLSIAWELYDRLMRGELK